MSIKKTVRSVSKRDELEDYFNKYRDLIGLDSISIEDTCIDLDTEISVEHYKLILKHWLDATKQEKNIIFESEQERRLKKKTTSALKKKKSHNIKSEPYKPKLNDLKSLLKNICEITDYGNYLIELLDDDNLELLIEYVENFKIWSERFEKYVISSALTDRKCRIHNVIKTSSTGKYKLVSRSDKRPEVKLNPKD
jgi:hypothetical protein